MKTSEQYYHQCCILEEEIEQLKHDHDAEIAKLQRLEYNFRRMRDSWFNRILMHKPHDREWEDEEHEKLRIEHNNTLRQKYDHQTEEILRGKSHNLTPTCGADL